MKPLAIVTVDSRVAGSPHAAVRPHKERPQSQRKRETERGRLAEGTLSSLLAPFGLGLHGGANRLLRWRGCGLRSASRLTDGDALLPPFRRPELALGFAPLIDADGDALLPVLGFLDLPALALALLHKLGHEVAGLKLRLLLELFLVHLLQHTFAAADLWLLYLLLLLFLQETLCIIDRRHVCDGRIHRRRFQRGRGLGVGGAGGGQHNAQE